MRSIRTPNTASLWSCRDIITPPSLRLPLLMLTSCLCFMCFPPFGRGGQRRDSAPQVALLGWVLGLADTKAKGRLWPPSGDLARLLWAIDVAGARSTWKFRNGSESCVQQKKKARNRLPVPGLSCSDRAIARSLNGVHGCT